MFILKYIINIDTRLNFTLANAVFFIFFTHFNNMTHILIIMRNEISCTFEAMRTIKKHHLMESFGYNFFWKVINEM